MEFSSARWPILPIQRKTRKPFLSPPHRERMHYTPSSAFIRTSTIAGRLFTFTFAFEAVLSGATHNESAGRWSLNSSDGDGTNKQQEGDSRWYSCNPWASVSEESPVFKKKEKKKQQETDGWVCFRWWWITWLSGFRGWMNGLEPVFHLKTGLFVLNVASRAVFSLVIYC